VAENFTHILYPAAAATRGPIIGSTDMASVTAPRAGLLYHKDRVVWDTDSLTVLSVESGSCTVLFKAPVTDHLYERVYCTGSGYPFEA
jgi:hypothetical protein